MKPPLALLALLSPLAALACGEVVTVQTHGGTSTRYALAIPEGAKAAFVLLAGGGGPGARASGLAACEGRSPHGFVEQEAEVAAGIARFALGGRY